HQERSIKLYVRPRSALIGDQGKTYPFTITATPQETPALARKITGEWVHLAPTFEVSLRPQKQSGVYEGTFRLQIRNLDNAELILQMEATDPEEGCLYTFEPARVVAPAGSEQF